MTKHWRIQQPDPGHVRTLSSGLNCSPVTASILVNRNLTAVDTARAFLNPTLQQLKSPCAWKAMDTADGRIEKALHHQEKILIFGDYDVDGLTATVILFEFLQKAGASVSYYIPDRFTEGYSLQAHHIEGYAAQNRIALVITTDCGSSSHAGARAALKEGIDLIITDHHKVPDSLPEALAVINPQRPDCSAGFQNLAGVGVALALIICLRKHLRDNGYWENHPEPNLRSLCDLVALGTVADSVPLTGENRIFTRVGLDVIRTGSAHPGIEELLKISRTPRETVGAEDVGFRLAPRLNAAGRMDHAGRAAKLLLSDRSAEARKLALTLDSLNAQRKNTEQEMLQEILGYLHRHRQELDKRSLVLAGSHWHEGVLGIVAARLAEKFYRPVVLISTRGAFGKGSARCVDGINLYECLAACTDQLDHFGGHAMAAGLAIQVDAIPVFRDKFETVVRAETAEKHPVAVVCVDYEIQFDAICDRIVDEIETLEPFGNGNPDPVFMARDVRVRDSKIVGKHHRRMDLFQAGIAGDKVFGAIQFNVNTRIQQPDAFEKIAFRLHWNRWNGRKSIQMFIEDTLPKRQAADR